MIQHGKFSSLTLINWNGFFARTFELDELVTTLSGGNGAGKSTTMAAFITALIPDLTLLHFRNTTEAGATGGSKDKGLHGKLRAGVCYALLEVQNSKSERLICGVRLQQIAGRDKKVDLKPFILENPDPNLTPIELVTDKLLDRSVRILSIEALKTRFNDEAQGSIKLFNAITDYHAMMFDLGVLPKKLRSPADRSKYYRLIEASLYGGISSTITRSLRDYLLSENTGVRKAFQDMELALRENRMTLEAIAATQSDRDLFKHLITNTTDYVAADYVRHQNERRSQLEALCQLRFEYFRDLKLAQQKQTEQVALSEQLYQVQSSLPGLEANYEQLTTQLHLVQNALKQQEKRAQYQEEVSILEEKVFEQTEQVELAQMRFLETKDRTELLEAELETLIVQLSDYEQALSTQQTQSVQYQQALQMLDKIRTQLDNPELSVNEVLALEPTYQTKLDTLTQQLLQVKQHLNVEQTQATQFNQAYILVEKILQIQADCQIESGSSLNSALNSINAWQLAKKIEQQAFVLRNQVQHLPALQKELAQFKVQQLQQQQLNKVAKTLADSLQQSLSIAILKADDQLDLEALQTAQTVCEAQQESLQTALLNQQEQRIIAQQTQKQLEQTIQELKTTIPTWFKAQEERQAIEDSCGKTIEHQEDVMTILEELTQQERSLTQQKEALAQQKIKLDQTIKLLNEPNGTDDPRLTEIAQQLNGVLLAEIYSDVSVEDAPYFSALYGPVRNAIVVQDLAAIKEKLAQLTDCPEDLYLIEGDPNEFDMSLFESEEWTNSVLVKSGAKQWRLSTFPAVSLFGQAARAEQLEKSEQERKELIETLNGLAFDLQKNERLRKRLTQFVAQYLAIAFTSDPEVSLKQAQQAIQKQQQQAFLGQEQTKQNQAQLRQIENQLSQIEQLLEQQANWQGVADTSAHSTPAQREQDIAQKIAQAQQAQQYLAKAQFSIDQLIPMIEVLQFDPNETESAQVRYAELSAQIESVTEIQFTIAEIKQRQAHFNYVNFNATHQTDESIDFATHREALIGKRNELNQEKAQLKAQFEQLQEAYHAANQILTTLKTQFETKTELLNSLTEEYQAFAQVEQTVEQIETQRQNTQQQMLTIRQNITQLERKLNQCESDRFLLEQTIKQQIDRYRKQRKVSLQAKDALQKALALVKQHQLEKVLNRGELRYLETDRLRSLSDKALGTLRIALDKNELLRDLLRYSEEPKQPEKKIQFYLAVSEHLKERIRQDILKTDDPIVAIEQMEVELLRLKDELIARESQLTINSAAVANLIKKSIQREEQRIMQLNQGLQAVEFGQVQGVRLQMNLIESHALLLNALAHPGEFEEAIFTQGQLTFSQALAKLYQRLNPHLELRSSAQSVGEMLLDYRHYLNLEIEVNRGAEGWVKAESGALSTGEAIGTGMSILVMVIQSWEEESKRLRHKEIIPCRLLFLDEAARLDSKSIATLFELCAKLNMQLVIAAPENISPEKGTTYKLMRKVINGKEIVHVVGLKGFGSSS